MKRERTQLGLGRLVHWRQSRDNPQIIGQQLEFVDFPAAYRFLRKLLAFVVCQRETIEVHLQGTLLTLKLPGAPEAKLTEQHIALARAIETMAIGSGANNRSPRRNTRMAALSRKPMTAEQIHQTTRQIAAQIAGANQRLNHSSIDNLAATRLSAGASLEELTAAFLAAVNHRFLEPAARILWFLDHASDSKKEDRALVEQVLRDVAREALPTRPGMGEHLPSEIAARIAAAKKRRGFEARAAKLEFALELHKPGFWHSGGDE